MFGQWQVIRSAPSAYANPAELADLWEGASTLAVPAPVATIADGADIDDYDWWHRGTFDAAESTCVEFEG